MKISIDNTVKQITPNFSVGVMECDVVVEKNSLINDMIQNLETTIHRDIDIRDVVNLDTIVDGRNAYKAYGKDPSRYRLAVESLYRRLTKGNRLYRINNVVDLGNILSLETRKSVAVLDYNKIEGAIRIRLGTENDEYYGIGRGALNVSNIPIYEDSISPFGSVTSDTERTKITNTTSKVLLFIISFTGNNGLHAELKRAKTLYETFAKASNFDLYIIE